MTSLHRVIAVLLTLPACVVGCVAAWRSPYLELDVCVVLTGITFAAPVFWRGHWSCRFIMRTAIVAYFFRCAAFCIMGNDAVKIIVIGDTGMGLAAIGGAYVMRRAIHNCAGHRSWTAFQQLVREVNAPSHGYCGGEAVEEETHRKVRIGQEEESNWSPPQVSLKAIFLFTLAWAGVLAVGVTGGFGAGLVVLVLGFLLWLITGCIRPC